MKNALLFTTALLLANMAQAQFFTEAQTEANIQHYVSHTSFMGGGAAFFDADNDGDDDLYLTSGRDADHFYLNNGDGTFTLSTEAAGFLNTEFYYTTGVAAADINNDGWRDLFVYTWRDDDGELARNLLYINNGDGTFTESWPFPEDATFAIGATFLDYDLDGWLDLYVINYVETAGFIYDGGTIVGFDHTCFANQFYHNNGDGTFTERAEELGLADTGCALATAATDYNGDGDTDIYLANDFGEWIVPNRLFRNNFPDDGFTETSNYWNADLEMYGMGIAVGDIDQDLDLDYYVTNFGRNEMLRSDEGGFTNVTDECGADNTWVHQDSTLTVGWGTAFIDYDNDTDLDLYVANGYVPSPNFLPSTLFMNDKLYRNEGNLPFSDVGEELGITNRWAARGMAYSDYDNDGDIDLLSVVLNVPMNETGFATLLYRNNEGNTNNWLQLTLEGVAANRDAYGSRAIVYADGKALLREVTGGNSHASHPSTRLHFGLGEATTIDSVQVIWTGGRRIQTLTDLEINQHLRIVEDTTIAEIPVNTQDLLADDALQVWPNPTSDQLQVRWKYNSPLGQTQLQLLNSQGQIVRHWNWQLNTTLGQRALDLSGLPGGLYWLRVNSTEGQLSKRIVIAK